MYVILKIKGTQLILKIFDTLQYEKLKKIYALLSFSKTRWSSAENMFVRLLKLRICLTALPGEIFHNHSDQDLDFDAKASFIIQNPCFWKENTGMKLLFSPICHALRYMEGGRALYSSVYAIFLWIKYHISHLDINMRESLQLGIWI